MLTPIAAPSILGLFGFAGATFIVVSYLTGWYGNTTTPFYVFPFALFFGALAQSAAGFYSYRAGDGLATAMHGIWGSFWLAGGTISLRRGMRIASSRWRDDLPTGPAALRPHRHHGVEHGRVPPGGLRRVGGATLERFPVMHAGRESARDPIATARPQRERAA